jgi:predicted dehydrogenase
LPTSRVKGIFVEKPLTLSLADLDRLVELQETNPSVSVQVNYKRNFDPTYDSIIDFTRRSTLETGLGILQGIQAIYGGGVLAVLPHLTGFIDPLFERAVSVSGVFSPNKNMSNKDDPNVDGTIVYEFPEQDKQVSVSILGMGRNVDSTNMFPYFWEQNIIGSRGIIEIREEHGWTIEYREMRPSRIHKGEPITLPYRTGYVPSEIETHQPMEMIYNGLDNLVDSIEGKAQLKAGIHLARRAEEIAHALRQSANQGGQIVSLPLEDRSSGFKTIVAGGAHIRSLVERND